jgi:hypothetical protein
MKILTVIMRNDSPVIHCNDCPTFRSVTIALTPEQEALLMPRVTGSHAGVVETESVSRCFVEELE